MGYKIVKLDDPQGQCGLHPSHKWAVMDDVWGLKEAFRSKIGAEAYVAALKEEDAEAAAQRASQFKGTPGPWFFDGPRIDSKEYYVAEVHPLQPSLAIRNANARLIAAAPDLLAALMELVDIVEGHVEDGDTLDSLTLQPARAALAKAGIE